MTRANWFATAAFVSAAFVSAVALTVKVAGDTGAYLLPAWYLLWPL